MRLTPTKQVVRALFAKSGNQCAFPGCAHILVNGGNQFVAEICHIEAASPGGERYNKHQTDEDRRAYANLLILCHRHHIETNSLSVQEMRAMKRAHENMYENQHFHVNESLLDSMEKYWTEIEIQTRRHPAPDLAPKICKDASFDDLLRQAVQDLDFLENHLDVLRNSDDELPQIFRDFLKEHGIDSTRLDKVSYSANPFENRNWESHYLGSPNILIDLRTTLIHIEVKFYEECCTLRPNDKSMQAKLENAKRKLKEAAKAIYYD